MRLPRVSRRDMGRKGSMFRLVCRDASTPRMVSRFEASRRRNPSWEPHRLVLQLQTKVSLRPEWLWKFSHVVLAIIHCISRSKPYRLAAALQKYTKAWVSNKNPLWFYMLSRPDIYSCMGVVCLKYFEKSIA